MLKLQGRLVGRPLCIRRGLRENRAWPKLAGSSANNARNLESLQTRCIPHAKKQKKQAVDGSSVFGRSGAFPKRKSGNLSKD